MSYLEGDEFEIKNLFDLTNYIRIKLNDCEIERDLVIKAKKANHFGYKRLDPKKTAEHSYYRAYSYAVKLKNINPHFNELPNKSLDNIENLKNLLNWCFQYCQNEQKWLTVKEVAELCDVTSGRITQLCNDNKIINKGKGRRRLVEIYSAIKYFCDSKLEKLQQKQIKLGKDAMKDEADIKRDSNSLIL